MQLRLIALLDRLDAGFKCGASEERAQIIDLKRRLRDMKAERDRYLSSYIKLLEERASSGK